jgi:hypothetical protein
MTTAVLTFVMLCLSGQAAGKAVTLPDTPQGRHVAAYIQAFNSGDEKTFLAALDAHLSPELRTSHTAAQEVRMLNRMKGDFGKLTIDKIVRASATEIVVQAPTKDGARGTFSFQFEDQAPYLISGLDIDVQGGDLAARR